ncbi:MAG: transketolase [Flavobacteriaceae bacterium]|nr:transketolase [Flavobacteriaceae bacterium]|tara:strand:+ start:15315 stop:16151 length:837 start_codon:yes stop_codon:yes gene_type:complete
MKKLEDLVFQIRRDIVRMVNEVNSGHPGGSLGCTEFFTVLFFKIMNRKDDFDMNGKDEDLFFLSNGHISPVYYSTLARAGYFPVTELSTFRKINSRLQGHPTTHEGLPGIRIASGSLGQGMSVAIGAAISKKLNNDSNIIYSLHGDGELQEGQNWEAIMFASANKIDNIICTIDYNQKQIDGDLKDVLDLGDIPQKFESFNWHVIKLLEGNNLEKVEEALINAKKLTGNGKPVVIIMSTIMGNGVDYMMGTHKWHGVAPNDEELKIALDQNPETLKDY